MLILNYSHPFTEAQRKQIGTLLGTTPDVRDISTHVDRQRPLADVAVELSNAARLAPTEWQTLPILLNPPALAPVATALLAELHGRCGYFVPIMHIRPIPDSLPPQFEVGEIVNLQALRDAARSQRSG